MASTDNIPYNPPTTTSVPTTQNSGQKSAAWAKAQLLQEIRRKFGITLHSNMDLKTVTNQWDQALASNPNLASCYPEISAAMALASVATIAQDATVLANTVAKQATNIATVVANIIASANPLSPNPSFVATEIASVATTLALSIETAAITAATEGLIQLIDSAPVCNQS